MDNTMDPQGSGMPAGQPPPQGQDPGEDNEGMLMKLIEATKQGQGGGAAKGGEPSKGGEISPSEGVGVTDQMPQQM